MESFNKAKTGRFKINRSNSSFKSKFCLCFKPVSSVDDDAASFEPASFSTILSSSLMTREGTDGWRRSSKKKGDHNDHSCFWQILKKAFNTATSLMKKIKRRKAANRSKFSRSSIINMKLEKNSKQECKIGLESSNSSSALTPSSSTNSSSSSQALGSSSSPSSSITTTLSCTTPNLRGQKKGTNLGDNRNKPLCYILVTSLLILILWGKVSAIICISFWLYLLPRRCQQSERPGTANRAEEEFDTVEHKKKVIMEGSSERNRSCVIGMDSIITRSCPEEFNLF